MNLDHLNNSFVDKHTIKLLTHPHYSWDGVKIQIKEYLQKHGLIQKEKQNNHILNLTNRLSKLRQNNGNPKDIIETKTKLAELEQKLAERLRSEEHTSELQSP